MRVITLIWEPAMIDPDAIVPCNCSALRQAARHVTRLYDSELAAVGLGLNQYSILSRAQKLGSRTIQEIAENLVMDRSTLGHLLRPLLKRGLLRLEPSKEDRRSRVIRLTSAGKSLLAKARPHWVKAERRFESKIGAKPARGLRAVLVRVAAADFGFSDQQSA
jgi:DNA-binding MarR family transcriptional regulator